MTKTKLTTTAVILTLLVVLAAWLGITFSNKVKAEERMYSYAELEKARSDGYIDGLGDKNEYLTIISNLEWEKQQLERDLAKKYDEMVALYDSEVEKLKNQLKMDEELIKELAALAWGAEIDFSGASKELLEMQIAVYQGMIDVYRADMDVWREKLDNYSVLESKKAELAAAQYELYALKGSLIDYDKELSKIGEIFDICERYIVGERKNPIVRDPQTGMVFDASNYGLLLKEKGIDFFELNGRIYTDPERIMLCIFLVYYDLWYERGETQWRFMLGIENALGISSEYKFKQLTLQREYESVSLRFDRLTGDVLRLGYEVEKMVGDKAVAEYMIDQNKSILADLDAKINEIREQLKGVK